MLPDPLYTKSVNLMTSVLKIVLYSLPQFRIFAKAWLEDRFLVGPRKAYRFWRKFWWKQCGPWHFRKSMVRHVFLMMEVFTGRQSKLSQQGLCYFVKNSPWHAHNPTFPGFLPTSYIKCGPGFTPAPLTSYNLCLLTFSHKSPYI